MSRVIFTSLDEAAVTSKCAAADVGISAIETLPGSGVRLVCKSVEGAELMRSKLKSHVMKTEPARYKFRPRTPLW